LGALTLDTLFTLIQPTVRRSRKSVPAGVYWMKFRIKIAGEDAGAPRGMQMLLEVIQFFL
jgi:hypothetical protein